MTVLVVNRIFFAKYIFFAIFFARAVDKISTDVEKFSTGVDKLSTGVENLSTAVEKIFTAVDKFCTGVDNCRRSFLGNKKPHGG